MQIACHRCGAMLDEGTPFCPSCGAPQIRVSPEQATPPVPPGTPGNMQPPAIPVVVDTRIDWAVGFKASLLTGAVAAALAATLANIPLVGLTCCLWLIGGAALTVKLYQRSRPSDMTVGMGARLGAVMGLVTFGCWFVLRAAVETIRGGFRARMIEEMRRAAATNPDPNAQQVFQKLMTPEGIAIVVTVGIVMTLLAFIVFGIAGGALGASLWGRRKSS